MPGLYGNTNILDITSGPIGSTGGFVPLSWDTQLSVSVYNASGDFLHSRTFDQVDKSATAGILYFQKYELNIGGQANTKGVQVNIQGILGDYGFNLPQGVYHIVTNFVHVIDTAATFQQISTDRKEIRFAGTPGQDETKDISFGENDVPINLGHHKFDLGTGRFVAMVNWTLVEGDLVCKLDQPLPPDVFPGGVYPLYIDMSCPTKMTVHWEVESEEPTYQYLYPNFDINVRSGTPVPTDWKTFEDITSTVTETKTSIIDRYLSGSLDGVEVSINYQRPEEFIHFSSYEERLLNFKYKLQLIEKYDTDLAAVNTITGDVATSPNVTTDKAKIVDQRGDVISNFDRFEKYMYNESSSYVTGSLGEWWSNAWPKSTTIAPHKIYATTSSEAQVWLAEAQASASLYDRNNMDMLSKALPEYITLDENNSTIITLTDMIGQHYDVIWTYIKGLTDVHSRDEDLHFGIAKDLLWHVGASLGMNMPNGKAAEDLWKWSLGTDESGSMATSGTGYASGSLLQLSSEDITKTYWNRLINNLPYLLKVRGTTRGVKAVLACYGVPSTIIDIKEYGGPRGVTDTENQFLIEDKTNYAAHLTQDYTSDDGERFGLQLAKDSTDSRTPRAFEFRFKVDQKRDMCLLEKRYGTNGKGWHIHLHHSSSITQTATPRYASSTIPQIAQVPKTVGGIYGRLTFLLSGSSGGPISASTPYLPLYNDDWWNVVLQSDVTASIDAVSDNTTQNQKWHLIVQSAKDHSGGRVTHSGSATLDNVPGDDSASYNASWRGLYDYWWLGGRKNTSEASRYDSTGIRGTAGQTKMFSGSLQEFRIWGGDQKLEDDVIDIHTLSPKSYVGNNFSSSYDWLWARFPLGTQFTKSNLSGSDGTYISPTIISSSHPAQTIDWTGGTYALHLTASNFNNSTTQSNGSHFELNTETFYIALPSTPSNTISSTKIRLEDSMLTKQLSAFDRAEFSEYDRHPIDTNTVGVHLSLQHQINRDIAFQFGPMRIDDYIGDPEHLNLPNYPDLEALQRFYFKKLYKKPDMADFARMITLYDISMFEMIKRMIPARANAYVGLCIEPTILERSKVQRLPVITQTSDTYRTVLNVKDKSLPSMSSAVVPEYSTILLTAGGENWYRFGAETANPQNFGDLSDTIILANESASYNGARYRWIQHYRNQNADGTWTVGSYQYTSDPFNTVVTGSRTSDNRTIRLYQYSSSFSASWDSDRGMQAGLAGYGLSGPNAKSWNTNKGLVENGKFDRQRGKAHIYRGSSQVPTQAAESNDFEPTGFWNARYNGSKLISGQYNQDSPMTSDGGPVIELHDSNPNQLIVTSPNVYGGSLQVPGIHVAAGLGPGQKYDKFGNIVSIASNQVLSADSTAVSNQQNQSSQQSDASSGDYA